MKHFNLKSHPLAFFLVLVLSLAAIAATTNWYDGTIAPRADDAYDLGDTTHEWRNIYIDGHAYLDSATITNITTPWSTLSLTTGVSSALTPTVDNNYDLGSQTYRWRNLSIAGIAGGLTPTTDDSRDLGSSALEWRNIYVDGTANLDAAIITTATVTTGAITTLSVPTGVASPLTPTIDDDYDLGSSTKEWKNVFVDGYVKVDSIALDGGANLDHSWTFALTGPTVTSREWARWKLNRAVTVKRMDIFSPATVNGGTLGVTVSDGTTACNLATTATVATATFNTAYTASSTLILTTNKGGASGGENSQIVIQYQDH